MFRLISLPVLASFLWGEQVPVRSYTTVDGLASNSIHRIVPDSRGYLWFCTDEGVSQFDGYQFRNYGISEGLPHAIVRDLVESVDGGYWVATWGGLSRFNTSGSGPRFVTCNPGSSRRSQRINALLRDNADTIWCGTD